ncbi:MAG: TolC family protein [Alphaproteobacteria bacterium]|nr:TolC family protein [Alphaproteobacteria bacterium]MBQ6854892.1 TolC family protein [Alphaproteobacteria bacterium]MBR3913181.1 TolC family protein [Alphaproteobacteria bacterium]
MMIKTILKTGCAVALLISAIPAVALDPFSVYRANAPKDCIDKDIGTGQLGLSELLEIGLCNNPALNRDYMGVKSSEASLGKSKSEYLPNIDVSGSFSDTVSKKESLDSHQSNPYSANVALSWLLYDFGGRSARIEREKEYLNQTLFSYKSTVHNTILAIQNAYLDLLGSEEVLKSAKTSEASYKKSYEESARRYELGLVSLSDKLQAKTSYEQSKLDVVTAQNTVKQNQGNLAVLLNISPDATFNLKHPPKDKTKNFAKLESGDLSVQKLMDMALDLRPEIKSAQSAVRASKEGIGVAKSKLYPSFSATGRLSVGDDWKYDNPYETGSSVGLNVSVPLFTGFSNTYNIAQAKYQYKQAEYSLADTKESVKNEVWSAYQNYKTAVTAHEISEKVLESAVEAERVAFAMYQVGKGDILTLLTAGSNLASARKEVIVAYYAVLKSKANLYRAVGQF